MCDVLPGEKSDCPQYVLDSLYELLNTVLLCILSLKDAADKNLLPHQRECYELKEKQAVDLLIRNSRASAPKPNPSNNTTNSKKVMYGVPTTFTTPRTQVPLSNLYSTNSENQLNSDLCDVRSNKSHRNELCHDPAKSPLDKTFQQTNDVIAKRTSYPFNVLPQRDYITEGPYPTTVRHKSTIISPTFLTLHENIMSGEEFSAFFCLPCNSFFIEYEAWKAHCNSDLSHREKVKSNDVHHTSLCQMCRLLIFGNEEICEIYLDFHNQNHVTVESREIVTSKEPLECFKPTYKFKKITYESINNRSTMYIHCGFCDVNFFKKEIWLRHSKKAHSKEFHDSNKTVVSCDNCQLIIQAPEHALNDLLLYHNMKHVVPSSSDVSGQIDSTSGSRNDSRASSKCENDNSSIGQRSSRAGKGQPYITPHFNVMNEKIHSQNITNSYYCRPCDKPHWSELDWDKHCKTRKHVSFMNNENYKFKGLCSYCYLQILGTEVSVKQYFVHHSKGHNNIPSFTFEFLSHERGRGIKNKILTSTKIESVADQSDNTNSDIHDEIENMNSNAHNERDYKNNDLHNKPENTPSDTNQRLESIHSSGFHDEESWYESSNRDIAINRLKEIYEAKKTEPKD